MFHAGAGATPGAPAAGTARRAHVISSVRTMRRT